MVVFDGLVGAIAWPIFKRWWARHHNHEVCDPKTEPVCSICHQPDRPGGHPECAEAARAQA